jgi:N-acetylmuramoyl-L-alanine amidase
MYDQNYDCYQVVAGKKSGPEPNFKNYDYVLEIHFNATAESGKDTKGDGSYKGIGMYVNSSKKNTTIDKKFVSAVSTATGFPIWGRGTGIFTSSGLLNARTCQSKGVSYGLLETAFIDDKDDITFYNKNKEKMAQAVADALISYFS